MTHLNLEPVQPLVQINLYAHCTTLTRTEGDAVQTYLVDDKTIANLFAPARSIATGFLPPHILAWGMDAQESEWVVAYFKPAVRDVVLRNGGKTERLTLPFPGCVLRGHGRSYAIWAVKRRPQNANALLYRFPAPNVHGNGAICNGSATFPQASLATIDTALDTFFTSAFNDHLAGEAIHDGKLLDLWRALHMQRALDDKRSLDDKQALANEQTSQALAQLPESKHQHSKHSKPKAQRFPTDRLIRAGRLQEIL